MHRIVGVGTRLQGGTPRGDGELADPRGLLLRGVVTATYVTDDPERPLLEGDRAIGVYCDVLVYSSLPQVRYQYLRAVPVTQDRSGLHSGRVWKPRAATMDITGGTLDLAKGTDPAAMDGDHVLIGFLDRNLARPVILRALPHPACDAGNDGAGTGHRLRLQLADGDPDFWRHHGTYYGVEDSGNWVVDTTKANTGTLATDGTEPAPPTDGSGAQEHRLPQDAEFGVRFLDMADPDNPVEVTTLSLLVDALELAIGQGANLRLEGKAGDATLTLGDGEKHAVIYEALELWWNGTVKLLLNAFDAHVHPSAMGPTGPPAPIVAAPDLSTGAKSSKLLFPDG